MDPTIPYSIAHPTVLESNGLSVIGVLAVIGAVVWIVGLLWLIFSDVIHVWKHHGDHDNSDQPPSPR